MIEEDRRRRKRGGIFGEDFVERDRLLAIGWDCNAIEMRDERI